MSKLSVLISSEQIQARIQEMGAQIGRDNPPGPIVLVGILKGSFMFLADLARAIPTPVRVEFIGISSYGKDKTSSGEVKLTRVTHRARTSGEGWALKTPAPATSSAAMART